MELIRTDALVCAVRPHGEHGVVARLLTPAHGLLPGYVRGGRGRRMRPLLLPGNVVRAEYRRRTGELMAGLTVELVASRAQVLGEPLAAAGTAWIAALLAASLPEEQPFARLHGAAMALVAAMAEGVQARRWAAALARFELLLLAELGFGLALDACAVTGTADNLAFVSPRSGRAVSRAAAGLHAPRLLPLPPLLREGGEAGWDAILAALAVTGHFLDRDVLRQPGLREARGRLVDQFKRLDPALPAD